VCRDYYRPINIPKLVEIEFCRVPGDMMLANMIQANKVADATSIPGLLEMEESDIPQVADLFRRYQSRFTLVPQYSVEEVRHQFLSGCGNWAGWGWWTRKKDQTGHLALALWR